MSDMEGLKLTATTRGQKEMRLKAGSSLSGVLCGCRCLWSTKKNENSQIISARCYLTKTVVQLVGFIAAAGRLVGYQTGSEYNVAPTEDEHDTTDKGERI